MTQSYVGTKLVMAWEQDKDGQAGYAVKYEDGYTGWSPKATFEQAYIAIGHIGTLPPHAQRVVAELATLDSNLTKLGTFISNDASKTLHPEDFSLLCEQERVMRELRDILTIRVHRFRSAS